MPILGLLIAVFGIVLALINVLRNSFQKPNVKKSTTQEKIRIVSYIMLTVVTFINIVTTGSNLMNRQKRQEVATEINNTANATASSETSNERQEATENKIFDETYDEYRTLMNKELAKDREYSNFSLSEFKEVGTDESYMDYEYLKTNLYKATISKNVDVYVLANEKSGLIFQIRFSTSIKEDAGDTKLMGWLLGRTMRLMYGNVPDSERRKLLNELSLDSPYESMNMTHTFKQSIYRSKVNNNVLTIYVTDSEYAYSEEDKTAITTYEEQAKIEAVEAEKKRKEEQAAVVKLAAKERTFSAGNYKVGTDIDAGTYNIIAISGSGNCFVDNTSGRSILNEIFASVEDDFHIKEYKIIELLAGYTIKIKSSLKLKFSPVK